MNWNTQSDEDSLSIKNLQINVSDLVFRKFDSIAN